MVKPDGFTNLGFLLAGGLHRFSNISQIYVDNRKSCVYNYCGDYGDTKLNTLCVSLFFEVTSHEFFRKH